MSIIFTTRHPAIVHLKTVDHHLGKWIDAIGEVSLQDAHHDLPTTLAEMIVAQQLSGKVATVIWNRVVTEFGYPLRWNDLYLASVETLRSLGLSKGKASYLIGLANKVVVDPKFFNDLTVLSDEAIIERLTSIKGIGPWTAHMFLIFTLHRLDVSASGDLGLKLALSKLLKLEEMVSAKQFDEKTAHWAPYRSVAALYLWRAHDAKLNEN